VCKNHAGDSFPSVFVRVSLRSMRAKCVCVVSIDLFSCPAFFRLYFLFSRFIVESSIRKCTMHSPSMCFMMLSATYFLYSCLFHSLALFCVFIGLRRTQDFRRVCDLKGRGEIIICTSVKVYCTQEVNQIKFLIGSFIKNLIQITCSCNSSGRVPYIYRDVL